MNFHAGSSILIILSIYICVGHSILNGELVKEDDFKYQISLWKNGTHQCGGAVIDEWHILTAAHCTICTPESEFRIYAGSTCLMKNCECIYEVESIRLHEDFYISYGMNENGVVALQSLINDIAIITLKTPMSLGMWIEAVPLPTESTPPAWNSICRIAGWGPYSMHQSIKVYRLAWTNAVILEPNQCEYLQTPILDNELCTLDPAVRSTTLEGDSGGGLVCDGILFGIASTTIDNPNLPATYASVYHHLEFIETTLAQDERNRVFRQGKRMQTDAEIAPHCTFPCQCL